MTHEEIRSRLVVKHQLAVNFATIIAAREDVEITEVINISMGMAEELVTRIDEERRIVDENLAIMEAKAQAEAKREGDGYAAPSIEEVDERVSAFINTMMNIVKNPRVRKV